MVAQLMTAVAVIAVASTALHAEASVPAASVDSIHVSARAARSSRCTSEGCRSLIVVDRLMDVLLSAQATTQGLTRLLPEDRDDIVQTRLNAVLLDHPALFPAVCHTLAGLAAQYPPGDLFVAVSAIRVALLMDDRSGQCLTRLMGAFPRSSQADAAFNDARVLCNAAWHLAPHRCDAIGTRQ